MHEEKGPSQEHEDERKPQASMNPPEPSSEDIEHVASAVHLQSTDSQVVAEDAIQQQASPLSTPGGILKQARERMNYSIESVAQHLKLSLVNTKAIEKDEYASMQMAPVFIKGHLRGYARYVKIDPDYMVRCYAQAGGEVNEHNPLHGVTQEDHKRLSRNKQIKKWLLIDGFAILVVVLALYGYMHGSGGGQMTMVESEVLHELKPEAAVSTKQLLPTGQFKQITPKHQSDDKQVFTLLEEAD